MSKGFLIGLLLLAVVPPAMAQGVVGSPYIAVHGSAKTSVTPDIFPLTVTLEETSKDSAAAQARIESLAKAVLVVAAEQKVADKDLKVGNISIQPDNEYDEATRKRVFVGNAYQRIIELRFHELETLKRALATLPGGEQVKVETGEFEYSRAEETRKGLVAEAIANARATAAQMAEGVGMRITGVQSVSNERISTGVTYSDSYAPAASADMSGSRSGNVVLKEGAIELEQDIYIIYLIAK